ncbi:MAG: class I SAM-dependent methyltransferase [Gaiellaceae bacterium]
MNELLERAGRRFARLAARAVVAWPGLWRLFRGPLRLQFDRLAPVWEARRGAEALAPLTAALDHLEEEPRRVLDLGTGTGKGARLVAERFPQAEVVAVDLAPAMVAEARRLLAPELAGRVRFEVADASALPFEDRAFDLVVLLNMIPFFEELARVTAPGGVLVFAWFSGSATPIYTPPATLEERLAPLGFERFQRLAAGEGTALLARRRKPG